MINKERLQEVLTTYKQNFVGEWWNDEKYKWEAIKGFQDNWDIDAPDFADMLDRSLKKTGNLLLSSYYYPKSMIIELAQVAPEKVRQMFADLFDEEQDVVKRITAFKEQADSVLVESFNGTMKRHYQGENAIATYLWLKYPDKYYIYKITEAKQLAKKLQSDATFKNGAYEGNIFNFLRLYDEVNEAIKEDNELKALLQDNLTAECYPDPELKTLTVDLGYYISTLYATKAKANKAVLWTSDDFLWAKFYSAFANKLLSFADDRKTLIQKLVGVYEDLGLSFPKLEKDGNVTDVDPFTVYGMFNKGLTNDNRIAIIKALAQALELDSDIEIPEKFNGIPFVQNLNASFFAWERPDDDIDNLWSIFECALNYDGAENKEEYIDRFVDAYDKVVEQKGVKWNITMGLYWIRPYSYLSLDQRSRWFIEEYCPDIIDDVSVLKELPDGKTYLSLCETVVKNLQKGKYAYKTLLELSLAAYLESERINKENKKAQKEQSETTEEDPNAVHYWIYSPGPGGERWEEYYNKGIMAIGWRELGNLSIFTDKEQARDAVRTTYNKEGSCKNDTTAVWQFAKELKVGDVVFAKKGVSQIVGRGIVESDYIYDDTEPDDYCNMRKVKWTHKGEWEHPGQAVLKTLTDITQYTEYVEKLNALFAPYDEVACAEAEVETIVLPAYTEKDFLSEVYMTEEKYKFLVEILKRKKNIILQGAPGVGKTFSAERLAWSIMGVIDKARVEFVQFHQNYSYEDFIMGYKPVQDGFELKDGIFKRFAEKAKAQPDLDFFFIIDEINRGNMSKIFGELLMAIESDHRDENVTLAYNGEPFCVPQNLYIIGMMNTADRSLAMIDYALRRRFGFFEMEPGFETEGFIANKPSSEKFDVLISKIKDLNVAIARDKSLGKGFCIGHSYFCNPSSDIDGWLRSIVDYEIIPMLNEYWFDEPSEVQAWSDTLHNALK